MAVLLVASGVVLERVAPMAVLVAPVVLKADHYTDGRVETAGGVANRAQNDR